MKYSQTSQRRLKLNAFVKMQMKDLRLCRGNNKYVSNGVICCLSVKLEFYKLGVYILIRFSIRGLKRKIEYYKLEYAQTNASKLGN